MERRKNYCATSNVLNLDPRVNLHIISLIFRKESTAAEEENYQSGLECKRLNKDTKHSDSTALLK